MLDVLALAISDLRSRGFLSLSIRCNSVDRSLPFIELFRSKIFRAAPHLEMLRSSKLYVREILQNFITNAVKYTQKGSVTIAAFAKSNGVLFEVRDTGIGISTGDQRKLFGKFFRADDPRTQKENGTGLGLYVTMKLSKLIGAELDVHSELNQGSTFSIFVPNLNLPTIKTPSNQPVTGLTPPIS